MSELLSFNVLSLFTLENLLAIITGTLFGMAIGAMPGLGPTVGVAVMMPLTYSLDIVPSVLCWWRFIREPNTAARYRQFCWGFRERHRPAPRRWTEIRLPKKGFPARRWDIR